MSKMVVNLQESAPQAGTLENYEADQPKRRWPRVLGIFVSILLLLVVVAGVAGFFYWRHLQTTPQYSLAVMIDAARNNDDKTVNEIVDTDAVIDDFVPQVTDKAVELYGRGLPKPLIKQIARIASPVLDVVKERARAELPRQLHERTKPFENVPFVALVIGADRYLDITYEGEVATVKSKIKDRPLELRMKKVGERWKVVAVKDEKLSERIAKRIGQQLIALVQQRSSSSIRKAGERIGIKNLNDLLKRAQEVIRNP